MKSVGEGGLINVRFGALSGHKSDIVIRPLCAGSRRGSFSAYAIV